MPEATSISRRTLLASAAAAALVRPARARDRKPNLLFVMADDHAGYVLGADENRRALTPNLDRLASEGFGMTMTGAGWSAAMVPVCGI